MAFPDKGKVAETLGMDVSGEDDAEMSPGDSDTAGKEDAAKRFFEAGKAGQYGKAADAFATMMRLCESGYDEEV